MAIISNKALLLTLSFKMSLIFQFKRKMYPFYLVTWNVGRDGVCYGERKIIAYKKNKLCLLSILYIKNTNKEYFIRIYNIDRTLRALISQKPMFSQGIKHRKSVFYCFAHI